MGGTRASDPTNARQAATAVARRLREAGHTAYFAGGCVRDALLGLRPTDYDIATDATPERVKSLFRRTQEVGAAFGVVLVLLHPEDWGGTGGRDSRVAVEVATFRADGPYSDARRPDAVKFSDARTDAERRDFTINALFIDPFGAEATDATAVRDVEGSPLGTVIDFVGGLADLRGKLIRAVGDPEKRLAEDHLRALRAVRFAARFGFAIDGATASAISRHASALRGVSRERIGDEVRRMLAHQARASASDLLQNLGLDALVLEEPGVQAPLRVLGALGETFSPTAARFGVALAAWAVDRHRMREPLGWPRGQEIGRIVPQYRRAMTLSNEESDALRGVLELAAIATDGWEHRPVAERKRVAGRELFGPAMDLVAAADGALAARLRQDVARLAADGIGIAPVPILSGDDLVAAGFNPGPAFKRALDAVYDAQLEGRIRERGAALELVRRLGV